VYSGQISTTTLLIVHQPNITRSKDEAIEILRQYEAQIKTNPDKSNEKFKELATKHSDCSSHEAGGDLGWFGPGQMQKPFEDGTYALEVGQISDVVSSDSGVHLIMRTG
jgi:NIMA-interacting peptidyl-prolyl cis-trans isomerase 1